MILSADEKHLFLLGYPEYLPNSTLQLYRLSVRDGECEAVGDSIPIVSEEIATNANLYFNEELNEFYCSVQEFEKHGQVTTRLYSLSAPPVTLDDVEYYSRRRNALNAGLLGSSRGMEYYCWRPVYGASCTISGSGTGRLPRPHLPEYVRKKCPIYRKFRLWSHRK